MPKVTANGKVFNFPEGTTQEQIGEAVDEYFSSSAPAEEYTPDIKPQIPQGVPLPHGMTQASIDAANKRTQKKNQYEESFVGDKESQRIREEESNRGLIDSILEGAKHVGKEFYAGTLQSPDFLPEGLQNVLDYRVGGDNTKTRDEVESEIDSEMDAHNKRYRITRGENPIGTTIGEMLPYVGTGMIGERALLNIGGKLNPLAKDASIAMNRKLGNEVAANRIANRPPVNKSDFQQSMDIVGRGTLTGAAEGAAQHGSTAGEGALFSAVGGTSAMVGPMKNLNKVRNEHDAVGKNLIAEMDEQGFSITPGLRTGNKALQTEEAGIRNSDEFAQEYYNLIDRQNEKVITKMAGDAIEIPHVKNRERFGQDELSSHMDNLSNEYKALEASTTGKFTKDSYSRMSRVLKDMQPTEHRNVSKAAKARYEVVKDIFNEMKRDMQKPTNMPGTGKFEWVFDGSKYQGMSQRVSNEIKTAVNSGDKVLIDQLKKIKTELDGAIEVGLGKAKSAEWKDLNERYAMTNMLLENGLDASGKVNPRGITNAVMSKDEAVRTLTGSGGKIKKFQDIAKYNSVLDGTAGGSLTGLGDSSKHSTGSRGLFKRGADYLTKPARLGALGYRLNTLRTPFIGERLSPAHGVNPSTSIGAGRAFGQVETISDLIDVIKGEYEEATQDVQPPWK